MGSERSKAVSFATAARIVLGAVFVFLGVMKLRDPIAFLKAIREYEMFGDDAFRPLNFIAATLPWAEVLLGALLVLGIARRGAALVVVAMLVPFTIAIALRAREVSAAGGIALCEVAFDCGCGTGVVNACRKLAENAALIALGTWVLLAPRTALALKDGFTRPCA